MFKTKADANAWLAAQETAVREGRFVDPTAGRITFAEYSAAWLDRRHDLRPRSRELYESLLRLHLVPRFGGIELMRIQPATVRDWWSAIAGPEGPGASTAAKSYRLLRAILRTALDDELITRSPCNIRGAGVERPKERPVASIAEVSALAAAVRPSIRLAVLLAAWCGLRRGEILGLERRDFDVAGGTVDVERTRQGLSNGLVVVGPPKTAAGIRTISIPPHLLPEVELHLREFVQPEQTAPVFTGLKGGPLRALSLQTEWDRAREQTGLGHLHFHDLRHSGNTWAAATGASTRELMNRMGHASARAALLYQHATRDRDQAIANALSALAEAAADSSTPGHAATAWVTFGSRDPSGAISSEPQRSDLSPSSR